MSNEKRMTKADREFLKETIEKASVEELVQLMQGMLKIAPQTEAPFRLLMLALTQMDKQ